MKSVLLAGLLPIVMLGQQQQPLPDNPAPQIKGVGTITPGKGASTSSVPDGPEQSAPQAPAPSAQLPASSGGAAARVDGFQQTAPDLQVVAEPGTKTYVLPTVTVNFVEVPFTVKDKSGSLVPGLTWRDVQIFENGTRQQIRLFSVDPAPLSVAMVIDQSLDFKTMERVNESLGALQGAFTPYDEMAIYTYNNGPREVTSYTGAQSNRIVASLERAKAPGRDTMVFNSGPLSQTTNVNGHQFDPNTSPVRNSNSNFQTIPKEVHTLNDAILAAATSLAKRPKGRRRVIYVISDGKEAGSTAKYKDVVKFLQTNRISVYATVVGDSSTPITGFLTRFNLPFQMKDNILPQYAAATGGQAISEFRRKSIETSFSRIAEQVRTQYTLGYVSKESTLDPKFRSIEVQVMRPNLEVLAKKGYYPTPEAMRSGSHVPAAQ